ncbi:MAG: DUF4388 domain-containing protein [Desulfuromonadales bacterium]
MNKVMLDSSGRLALPLPAAKKVGLRTLELTSHSEEHLFFTVPGEEEPVVLAGLLGEVSVADLLSFFNMFRKTGILRFILTGGVKDLYFQQGEIVFAESTFPEEDVGEILLGLGKVGREALQKARQFATARTPVGKVLVEKGDIAPRDLWLATRSRAEAIVFHLFTVERGSFSFQARTLEKEDIVRLSMSTQNLIMEGLQRVDERALFQRRIPSLDLMVVPVSGREKEWTAAEQRLGPFLLERRHNVREILRRSGMGEFEGLRLLFQLMEKGLVTLEEAPEVEIGSEVGEILNIANGALVALFQRVNAKNPGFGLELRCFLRDLPQPFSYVFRDVSLREDGALDGARILTNLFGLGEEDQKKLLADALGELVFMECMAARRDLGQVESAELVRRVQEISRRIKALIGRNE